MHKIIAEKTSADQKPNKFHFKCSPKKQPSGKAIIQYDIKLHIITTFVFFSPLKMPEKVTCRPSKTWKKDNTYAIGIQTFIKLSSDVNKLIKNFGYKAIIQAEKDIKITLIPIPV